MAGSLGRRAWLGGRCLLGVGAVVLLGAAMPAEASEKAIWGPVTFPAGHNECGGGASCSAFPVYSKLGVDVYQYRLVWSDVAPTQPSDPTNPDDSAYRWPAELDEAAAQAKARGIELALLVERAPGWSNGGRSDIWGPTDPADFAEFLTAASVRYPSVRRWMIWGEPNRADHFMPTGDEGARAYSVLLDTSFTAINAVNRRDIVVGGMSDNFGTVPPSKWIKSLRLPGGGRPRMDEYGTNPFDARFPRLKDPPIAAFRGLNDVDTLWRDVRRAFGRPGRNRPRGLWLSEWTLQTGHDSFAFAFHVSERAQARRLTAGYRLARKAPYVRGLGWYRLDDQPESPNSANWGLETASGHRKPSFAAYAAVP